MARRKNGQADGSVTIDLNKPPPAEDKFEPELPDYGAKPADTPVEVKEEPKAPPSPPERTQDNDLETQLQAMKQRQQAAEQRAQQSEQARAAEQQRAQQALQQSRGEVEQSQYDSVANALLARQNELAILKQHKADARARGDTATELEIDDRLMDAKVEIRTLTDGKAELERQLQQRQYYQQQQSPQQQAPQQQQPASIDQVIASMPNLMTGEAEWLRSHPDAVFDPGQFRQLQAAFEASQKRGIERGTSEYYKFIDDRLGYESEEPQYDEVDMVDNPRDTSRPLPAAPPSRPSPGLSTRETPSSTRVTLTPLEREHARIARVSEHEYAKNKAKLADLKRRGMYGERG